MFDHYQTNPVFVALPARDPLRIFVERHRDGLLSAAALLGGKRGVRLVQAIIQDLRASRDLSVKCARNLQTLLDLLSLNFCDDDAWDGELSFYDIDPMSPTVEEICLLTDGLRQVVLDAAK
ncbi:hypothetical protein AQS8620_02243 [Aquimixticola soesokkakensis]|uniref:Uncharacterized protein n=1 Tax=Aquimixticola soesokkakensis TaxID=1519096 RepID=A0A1Y5SZB6_9RHOB|nr:hypothetical protein [Aquimixticola soesokkakensis]SLN51832.1 hypothetical protein AQS8620_02243 [Aquimixticola soesokkakensis]